MAERASILSRGLSIYTACPALDCLANRLQILWLSLLDDPQPPPRQQGLQRGVTGPEFRLSSICGWQTLRLTLRLTCRRRCSRRCLLPLPAAAARAGESRRGSGTTSPARDHPVI